MVEQLGLFKMPREMQSMDKDREEKALENQLINTAKGFLNSEKGENEEAKNVGKAALAV